MLIKPKSFWPHDLFFGLLPFLMAAIILFWVHYLPLGLRGLADFRQLYAGGYMIRAGHAYELYDYDAQMRFQEKVAPGTATAVLLVTHPAFEELLFVPLSLLPYRTAFWLFLTFNVTLLAVCLRLLKTKLTKLTER